MLPTLKKWYDARFHDEESIVLALLLALSVLALVFFGSLLTPIIAALVIAFLFQGVVNHLVRLNCPHLLAVIIAFVLIVAIEIATVIILVTMLFSQFGNLVNELPKSIEVLQSLIENLQVRYPAIVTAERAAEWTAMIQGELSRFGQWAVTFSQSNIPTMLSFFTYLVLVPMFVFFFLKDKTLLLGWVGRWLPDSRPLLNTVWADMNRQMANYIRGKFIEMLIVGGVSYAAFMLLGLNYAALLGFLVGASVIVPYVGALLVTIPVMLVAYMQWGWGVDLAWLFSVYVIIQVLDGNVLVPFLFSEAVNLHPVAILIAILFFGGIWGLWGVFFAIPLATLIKSVLDAWPSPQSVS